MLLNKLKKIVLDPMGYSENARLIINKWEECGGKVPKRRGTKVLEQSNNSIEILLSKKTNEYTVVDPDPEFANKEWTAKEICSCIDYYTKTLKKTINYPFPSFVVFRYSDYSKLSRSIPAFSPIVETFLSMPTISSDKFDSILAKMKKEIIPVLRGGHYYERVFIKAAKFIEKIESENKWEIPWNKSSFTDLLIEYVIEQLRYKPDWKIGYMAGEGFLNEYLNFYIRGHIIHPKGTGAFQYEKEKAIDDARRREDARKWKEEYCQADSIE
jgi:hypothetical protein